VLCPVCQNAKKVWMGDAYHTCPHCWGMEPSCCSGPEGEPFDPPTNPQESKDE